MKLMKFITHNQDDLINTNMTHLQGCITATYAQLVSTFGEPLPEGKFDDYKSDAEWLVQYEDGTVATIYNWKNGINYCGSEDGIPTEYITDWHVGGVCELAYLHTTHTIWRYKMRKQFKWSGGHDLHYTIQCTCPSERWKDTGVAHLFKTEIQLSGYADDYFFDEVNKEPRVIKCKCGKEYSVQWFRDGVECSTVTEEV